MNNKPDNRLIKTSPVYEFDQFFTKKEIASKCLKKLKSIYNLNNFTHIIEPSAGTGSFLKLLPKNKRIAIELDKKLCNENLEYIHKSFFNYIYPKANKNVLVIGNPPFGTQNKLSVDFFNHAAKFASVIAFIVPRTWKKDSIHNRLNEKFHLVNSLDLPEDCFEGNKETNVRCCFQIWKRSPKNRIKKDKFISHKDWNFLQYINKDMNLIPPVETDFVVLAYGSKPGQISTNLYDWRPKSVHFIKSNINIKTLMNRFKSLDYSCADNSARQSSLCKSDLVRLYSEKYGS